MADREDLLREQLARRLHQHQPSILQGWMAQLTNCPLLATVGRLVQRPDYLRVMSTWLKLFLRHLRHPQDTRCLYYTQRLTAEQFLQGVTPSEALQTLILLRRTLLALLRTAFSESPDTCAACVTLLDEAIEELQFAVTDTYHRTWQNEIHRHTHQLEQRLHTSFDQLQEVEARYRALFQVERQSAGQLAMIHEVGSRALTANTLQEFLDAVAVALQKNFEYYDVLLFIADHNAHEVVLTAHFGGYYKDLPKGYRQPVGVGIVGWVAQHGETLLANDVSQEPRHILAFAQEAKTRSELAVPIKLDETVLGVIDVQSQQLNAFDHRDVSALQTLADQMATAIENIFLYQEMRDLKEFNESVIDNIPAALMVIDADLHIVAVNQRLCDEVQRAPAEVVGHTVADLFDWVMLCEVGLTEHIRAAITRGQAAELMSTQRATTERPEKVFDIRITPLAAQNQQRALVVMTDMTRRLREAAHLQMLYQTSQFLLQGSLDFEQVLYTVLTCITAGPALGFNRAFLLLLDKEENELYGAMALGPANHEEAVIIWKEISYRDMSLEDLVDDYERFSQQEESLLQRAVKSVRIPLGDDPWPAATQAVRERRACRFNHVHTQPELWSPFPDLTPPNEFAVAPLIASEGVIGVVVADNVFNNQPIDDEDVQLLATLAHQAGLAIANAQAFNALQKAQEELVRREKLAAVGEMAARVSHEIRNPLSTVGGFARSILRKTHDLDRVRRNAQIIAEEVQQLEELLNDMLDLARPPKLVRRPENLHDILNQACLLTRGEIDKGAGIVIRKDYDPSLPLVYVDARSLLRAFLNVIRNAIQAMPEGGMLTIATRLNGSQVQITFADTGMGIPHHVLPTIFTPFVSHRVRGSGLGLPITHQIVKDHGGFIEVESAEGKGSQFTFYLPLQTPESEDRFEPEF